MTDPDQLTARMAQARGRSIPEYAFMADKVPAFLEAYDNAVSAALLYVPDPSVPLPMKYRELIVSTMLTLRSVSDQAIANHLRRALEGGLTEQEAIEGIEASFVPGGGPSVIKGMRALLIAKHDLAKAVEGNQQDAGVGQTPSGTNSTGPNR